jgi:WD40 repeat protein/tetratricopeptide (TPR) repeat protein
MSLSFSMLAQAAQLCRGNMLAECEACLAQIKPARRGWEWHYLDGLHRSELHVLSHPWHAIVKGVAFSPDGKHVAGAGGNPYLGQTVPYPGSVTIWETDSGRMVRSLDGFRAMTGVVAYSPDGKYLAAGCRDGSIRVWYAGTGKVIRALTSAGMGILEYFAWSPDSVHIAGAGQQGGVVVWEVRTGKVLHQLHRGKGGASYVAWSGDGSCLACCGSRVELWEMPAARRVRRLDHGADALAMSPDGRILACALGPIVHLHAIADGRLLGTLGGHTGRVSDVSFSPDGLLLATGSADSTVRIWNVEDSQQLALWRGHRGRVECVAFHPSGHMVASGSGQPGDVRLWDLTRQQESTRVSGPAPGNWTDALAIVTAKAGPAGANRYDVIMQRRNGNVEVRDAFTRLLRSNRQFPIHNPWRTPGVLGAFSGDVRTLVAIDGCDDRLARSWTIETGKPLPGSYRHDLPVWHVCSSRDGRLAASAALGMRPNRFQSEHSVWEPATGKVCWHRKDRDVRILAMQISPDGHWLARSVLTGKTVPIERGREFRFTGSAVELWAVPGPGQPAPARPALTLQTGKVYVFGLAFRADGKVLAGAAHSQGAFLWDVPSGNLVHARPLAGPKGLEGLAFSPDGRLLAGVSRTTLVVWDAIEGQQVASLSGAPPRSGDAGFSPRVAWSPDGRLLAATNWDHSVSVWDGADQASPAIRDEMRREASERLPAWHLDNAELAWHKGRRAAAEHHLDAVRKREPLPPGWMLERGHMLARMGDWDRAATDYTQALAGDPAYASAIWREHALLQARAGNVAACRHVAEIMLERFGRDADPSSRIYGVLASAVLPGAVKEPNDLVRMVRTAVDCPRGWQHSGLPLHSLAMAYLRAGRDDDAIATARQALEKDPGWGRQHVLTWLSLALAYQHQGKKDQARPWWDRAKSWLAEEEKRLAEAKRPVPPYLAWHDWVWIRQLHAETARAMGE